MDISWNRIFRVDMKGYRLDMWIIWLRIAGARLKVRFTVIAATLIWISVSSFVSGPPRLKVPCRFSSLEARDCGHPSLKGVGQPLLQDTGHTVAAWQMQDSGDWRHSIVAQHGRVRISLDIKIAKSTILDIKEDMTGFAAELLGVQPRRSNSSVPKQPTLPLRHSCLRRRQPLGFS